MMQMNLEGRLTLEALHTRLGIVEEELRTIEDLLQKLLARVTVAFYVQQMAVDSDTDSTQSAP